MGQIDLLEARPVPVLREGIDLRCCEVADLLDDPAVADSPLIIADPPWQYSQAPGHSADPELHYAGMSDRAIADLLDGAWDRIERGRLALWCTWPKLGQWEEATRAGRWRWIYKTGGSWHKTGGSQGTGFHWLGASELVLVYSKGTGLCTKWTSLPNAHTSARGRHSEKPAGWMAGWIERWTDPGDLVVDLFAGMGPVAVACLQTGRRYLGAEVCPIRAEAARLAIWRAGRV